MSASALIAALLSTDNTARSEAEVSDFFFRKSYFYIEKWTFKIMCEVCYRAKPDKKEAT